jgi:hypothetical protein
MSKQPTLRPSDLVVACQLALTPAAQFIDLSKSTGLSAGECHNAVRRLRLARLLLADERRPSADILQQFLVQGAPFAFPPVLGASTVGIPTAHSSPAFRALVESTDGFVWPHADGSARGQSLVPLFPAAPSLPGRNQPLYELLTIIDALRVGTTRIRKLAAELLAERLSRASVR